MARGPPWPGKRFSVREREKQREREGDKVEEREGAGLAPHRALPAARVPWSWLVQEKGDNGGDHYGR